MPTALDDVAGQAGAARLLGRLLARGRLPHALLLEGPAGCGRRTLARALAATVLCHRSGVTPCGVCPACGACDSGVHPDLVEVSTEAAFYPVDLIRHDIVGRVNETPLMGHGRFFLIPEAERLWGPAANVLLKVLEEPATGVHFVLTCTTASALPDTIRSRTWLLRLQAIPGSTGDGGPEASDLLALTGRGYDLARIAPLVDELERRCAGEPLAAQRLLLGEWIQGALRLAVAELRHDGEAAARRIARLEEALHDLRVNLSPRLVIEGLSLGP